MGFDEIKLLITRYNAGLASPHEKQQLEEWYDGVQGNSPVLNETQEESLKQSLFEGLSVN